MKRFLQMLLAVLFCTTAMCTTDIKADTYTNSNALTTNTPATQSLVQTKASNVKTDDNHKEFTYSDEEVYMTAQLMHHEAHNQPYEGKIAIAEVVLNRVRSGLFPNTVSEVLFQPGQFLSQRSLSRVNPTSQEINIANGVLNGRLRSLNNTHVFYFRNPMITSGIDASKDKDWGTFSYFTYIGSHAFYSQNVTRRATNTNIKDTKAASAAANAGIGVMSASASVPADGALSDAALTDAGMSCDMTGSADMMSTDDMEIMMPAEYVTSEMMLAAANMMAANAGTLTNDEALNADAMAATAAAAQTVTAPVEESDPVLRAQAQAKLDEKLAVERQAAKNAETARATAAAVEEAKKLEALNAK